MDSKEIDYTIHPLLQKPSGCIQVGITWIDGRILFKEHKKYAKIYYGICHYSKSIWAITPRDFEKPLGMLTINVEPTQMYCDRAYICLNFGCVLNRFDKMLFLNEFKDAGAFSLGLPNNLGVSPLWFNLPPYLTKWADFILKVTGGILAFNDGTIPVTTTLIGEGNV